MDKSKPFGLIISKRAQQSRRPAVSAVFGSDSDDEPSTKKKKMPSIPQAKPKKLPLPEVMEDPSIYEYDSIYDDMKAQEVAKVAPKDANKPSRYIGSLLKAADKRKKDQERRVEKKVHHEREQEGDKFADKESFVTSAYKKKMQEMEEEEERERRENMLNEMMDVTKQKDLSGFYRHFLKQSVGEENVPVFGERYEKKDGPVVVKQEAASDEEGAMPEPCKKEKNLDGDQDTTGGSSSRHRAAQLGKSSSKEGVDSAVPIQVKKEPVDKRKKDHGEDTGSSVPRTCNEGETLDSDVDRDTDMDSSSDEDDRVDKPSKEGGVRKLANKKAGGTDADSAVSGKNKKSLIGDFDRDSSSGDENAVGKSSKEGVLTEKATSLDDNVDRDTDIESSSEEEANGKVLQPSKDTEVGKSSKQTAHNEKSTLLVENVDQDSDSSGEDESGKAASTANVIFRKPSTHKDFSKKGLDNPGKKQSRNIRKRAEDVDSSPSSDESSSASEDEVAEKPTKANGGSKEETSISENVEQVKAQPQKPKVDIYAKRTVGDVFADAQVRYFQRMAARST